MYNYTNIEDLSTMTSSIREHIQAASSQNASLLSALHETDSAPSQLAQQNAYIADLESQLKSTSARVSKLKKATASELKDHKKYSESTFRRFAHKASGRKDKFEEKAAKEEREYFDAIQEQKTGEDQLAYLHQLRAEAETTKQGFETQTQRHHDLQKELDNLYESIFAGPTPGFPEEDERERECGSALSNVQHLSERLEKERHILFLLGQTASKLTEAARHLADAHSLSQMDLFGGGTLASMQKRNYLEKAESAISQVRMLQQQIHQVAPDGSADLGPMDIASGSIWGDVVFDNIFSDMDMHDKIKRSEVQVSAAGKKLGTIIRAAEGREKSVREELDSASTRLQQARRELQRAREEAFARVAGGQPAGDWDRHVDRGIGRTETMPPEYEAPEGPPPAYSGRS
jgi:hypothetical protein